MAPAGRAVVVVALALLYLCRAIFSTEYFSTLTFSDGELSEHGCGAPSEWEEYAADCGKGVAPSSYVSASEILTHQTSLSP